MYIFKIHKITSQNFYQENMWRLFYISASNIFTFRKRTFLSRSPQHFWLTEPSITERTPSRSPTSTSSSISGCSKTVKKLQLALQLLSLWLCQTPGDVTTSALVLRPRSRSTRLWPSITRTPTSHASTFRSCATSHDLKSTLGLRL